MEKKNPKHIIGQYPALKTFSWYFITIQNALYMLCLREKEISIS